MQLGLFYVSPQRKAWWRPVSNRRKTGVSQRVGLRF